MSGRRQLRTLGSCLLRWIVLLSIAALAKTEPAEAEPEEEEGGISAEEKQRRKNWAVIIMAGFVPPLLLVIIAMYIYDTCFAKRPEHSEEDEKEE
eukprot:TRINITY_DN26047_c0_g1_i2.p1 TRINITY_DN26047_c0_g1~~TRINITY_DN26047_c0_g1_i2.p1  ORF type:complete len:111 (+),score=21.36 TRINITY_DN26047_c0_g1_i2:51-335(+)